MNKFKKELQKLSVDDEFKQGEVTPWEYQGEYDPAQVQQCAFGQCFNCGGRCFSCSFFCFFRCFGGFPCGGCGRCGGCGGCGGCGCGGRRG